MAIKKKIIILVCVCLVVLVGAIVADKIMSRTYFNEIEYKDLMKKIENKENVIVLISQTTCSHCISYKPKLESVANDYKIDVYYIDVDLLNEDDRETLESHINFNSTPITVFLKNGEETSAATRINGNASIEKIKNKFKSNGFID